MAAHQVTVVDGEHRRRFDVVLYVNGMPLAFIELKKASADGDDAEGRARAADDLRGRVAAGVPLQRGLRGLRRARRAVRHRVHAVRALRAVERRRRRRAGQAARRSRSRTSRIMLLLHGMFQHDRFLDLLTGYVAFARDRRTGWSSGSPSRTSTSRCPRRSARRSRRCAATAGPAWSGTPRAPASRWRWSCTPTSAHPPVARQPDDRRAHRPDRPGRPALRHVPGQRPAAGEAASRSRTREELRAELANRRTGGIFFTTLQKFGRTKDERENGRPPPAAVGPAQHHRDRRRGAPLATTTTSTATPGTCGTRCRTPRSSRSPARRSRTAEPEHPRRLRRVHRRSTT